MIAFAAGALAVCAALVAVDGDTIKCDGQRMRLLGDGVPFISGIDTPERGKAKCAAERDLADRAWRRLSELLLTPGLKIELSGAVDFFQRPLVRLRLPDDSEAGQTLVGEGLAVVWSPKIKADWCRLGDADAIRKAR